MIIEGNSVAECWLKLLTRFVDDRASELSPVIVKINITDDVPPYRDELEQDLNSFLDEVGQPHIETTAGTIFPVSLSGKGQAVFDRYEKIWKYVKKEGKNKRGTYFHRLVAYADVYGRKTNQLKEIIDTYNGIEGVRNPVHRRSALIATTFDPTLDHTHQPQLGFPCLQQVCFLPDGDKMSMNAVYAMQHLSTRAYGNYVGLIRLGQFMAREMGLEFVQLNCMVSVLGLGQQMKKVVATSLAEKYA